MQFFGKEEVKEEVKEEIKEESAVKRTPWATWQIGDETYKLKLTVSTILELEKKYKTNLINIMGSGEGGMPALTVMLDITHAALKKYHHGIKMDAVNEMFERYEEEGGSQLEFFTNVYMSIFAASGFFSTSLSEEMKSEIQTATEKM